MLELKQWRNRQPTTEDKQMTLTTIDNIRQELRVDSKGVGYVSIRGAARICGVDDESIRKSITAADFLRTKLGRKLAQYGFKGDDFLNGISDVALSLIIEYYAFEANRTTPEAQMMMRTMAAVGLRTLIRQACGWNEQPVLTKEQKIAEALLLVHADLEKANQRIEQLEEITDELFGYSSIIRVAKYNLRREAEFNWRELKKASIELGLEIKSATCPRYGKKNLYPHAAWEYCYPDVLLPTAPLAET